jgi:5-methylcytosine-specific restriction endonuclease McrA
LIRRSPIPKKRSKPRRGQPTKEEKRQIRLAVFIRAGYRCEIKLHKQCWGTRTLPWDGDVFERGHLVHVKSRGAGGKWEMTNLLLGCPPCHLGSMHTEGKNPA